MCVCVRVCACGCSLVVNLIMGFGSMKSLPLGFRFRPTDEELINHYLSLKINGHHDEVQVIPEVDVCKWEPWDLPQLSVIKSDDPEWFFFCPHNRKYPNGHRFNRATDAGYWKATGKDRTIKSHKSSPSSNSSTHLIGMKKTLVFYRGRAPKGERTNWIMHEYSATEPDLDGTGSGQAAYVLCHLFHKLDEKADSSKYDEVEPSGSSPNTIKSTPDDTSSDLFQEPLIMDMQVSKQPAGIGRWLTDKLDDVTSNSLLHVESCTSGAEDHLTKAAIREVYPIIGGHPMCHESTDGLDCKVFSPLVSHNHTDRGCPDSPFTDDFGSSQNGMHFQDGTLEPDVSPAELLDVLHNYDAHPCKESKSEKFLYVGSRGMLPDQLHEGPARNYNSRDMVIQQAQTFPRSFQSQAPSRDADSRMSNDVGAFCDHYADPVSLGGDHQEGSGVKIHKRQASNRPGSDYAYPICLGGNHGEGTGIKIHKRQARNRPDSENLAKQGTATRRIHLQIQMNSAPIPIHGRKYSRAKSFSNEEQDEHSVITKDHEYVESSCTPNESVVGSTSSENGISARNFKVGLGLTNEEPDEKDKVKWKKFLLRPPGDISGTGSLTLYGVSMYLVMVVFILFVFLWKCPNFFALHI